MGAHEYRRGAGVRAVAANLLVERDEAAIHSPTMKCFLRCLSVPPERFVFVAGEHVKAGDRILLNAQQSLGRLSGNDIELHSETVARRHLTISVEGAALRIEDLGSTNGTYVNGDLTRRALLKPGDRLRVAVGFEFEIELEE